MYSYLSVVFHVVVECLHAVLYNKLINAGIVPVSVRVDGIEINKEDATKVNLATLFDIGSEPNQWKYEEVKVGPDSVFNDMQYIPRDVEPAFPETCVSIPVFNPDVILPRLTHFSGSGGNGKTQKLVELMKVYPNLCATAPTHDAADVISKKCGRQVYTYHNIFGIGCPPHIPNKTTQFAIDECSMLCEEHMTIIDTNLRKHFNRPSEMYGGAQIIIFGDFCQLPPISPLTSSHGSMLHIDDYAQIISWGQ